MKPALTGLICIWFLSTLQAQSSKNISIPVKVMDTFTLLYPDAKRIHWQTDSGLYTATFSNYKKSTVAVIRENGKVFLTETEINVKALPIPAMSYLTDEESAGKITSASIIEDETGKITFTAEMDNTDYLFDASGQLLASADDAHAPDRQ